MPIRSDRLRLDGARDRNRTGTPLDAKQQILSLRCLPISPPGRARKKTSSQTRLAEYWRRGPESNWADRICNPVHNRFATAPCGSPTRGRKREASASLFLFIGAGDGTGTRALSHCFPTTFSAAVIGEGLKYSLIFPPWRSTARPRCRQAFMTSPVAVRPTPGFTLARAPPPSAFTNSAIPITQGNSHCPPRVCNRARDLKPLHVLERRVRRQAPIL